MASTPRHARAPIDMRLVDTEDDIEKVGDYTFFVGQDEDQTTYISMAIPSRRRQGWTPTNIPIEEGDGRRGKCWGWNGKRAPVTLTPSVHTHGHWHGFIRNGQMVEA